MYNVARKIRKIYEKWTKSPVESFAEYKQLKIKSILDRLEPFNFSTPDEAFRLVHIMYADKMSYQDIEHQKRLADEMEEENANRSV